jgi:hypothetical protein
LKNLSFSNEESVAQILKLCRNSINRLEEIVLLRSKIFLNMPAADSETVPKDDEEVLTALVAAPSRHSRARPTAGVAVWHCGGVAVLYNGVTVQRVLCGGAIVRWCGSVVLIFVAGKRSNLKKWVGVMWW